MCKQFESESRFRMEQLFSQKNFRCRVFNANNLKIKKFYRQSRLPTDLQIWTSIGIMSTGLMDILYVLWDAQACDFSILNFSAIQKLSLPKSRKR